MAGDESNRKSLCDPCFLDSQRIEATGYCIDCKHFLCQDCCKIHTKPIPSRHHKVIDNLESVNMSASTFGRDAIADVTDRCLKHVTEVIKWFCKSHGLLGCGSCMMVGHRQCEITNIPEIAKSPEIEKEHRKFLNELENLEKEFNESQEQAELNIPEANRVYVDMNKDFLTFKKIIIDELDKVGKEIDERAAEIRDRDVKAMEDISKTCKKVIPQIRKLKDKSKTISGTNLGTLIFIHMKQSIKLLKAWHATLDDIQEDIDIQKYEFHPAIDLKDGGHLGKLVVFEDGDETESEFESDNEKEANPNQDDLEEPLGRSLSVPDFREEANKSPDPSGQRQRQYLKATFIRDVVAKASADFEKMQISGIALLPDNKLVIVDRGNQNVKLVDTKKNKVVDEIKVRYMIYNMWEPHGITAVDVNLVAITCADRQKIQLIKVKKSLSEGSALKVNGRCYGITYHNAKKVFVVTFVDPPKVEIIDRSGNTVGVLVPSFEAGQIFQRPSYALLSKDLKVLYISDSDKSKVFRINLEGDVTSVSVYSPGNHFEPLGMAIDNDGRVLVCDMADDSIHVLNEACKPIDIVGKGENKFPTCIMYNDIDDSFYLGISIEKVAVFRLEKASP